MSTYSPVSIGGLDVGIWIDMYKGCHTKGGVQFAWPDGNSYLQQDNLTVCVFRIIQNEIKGMNANG